MSINSNLYFKMIKKINLSKIYLNDMKPVSPTEL